MAQRQNTLGGDISYPGAAPSPDPMAVAGQLAKGYQQALPAGAPGAEAPMNPHMQGMHNAAEEARQKYMRENGVDENGELVSP